MKYDVRLYSPRRDPETGQMRPVESIVTVEAVTGDDAAEKASKGRVAGTVVRGVWATPHAEAEAPAPVAAEGGEADDKAPAKRTARA